MRKAYVAAITAVVAVALVLTQAIPALAYRNAPVSGTIQTYDNAPLTGNTTATYNTGTIGNTESVTTAGAMGSVGATVAMYEGVDTTLPTARRYDVNAVGCDRTTADSICGARGQITITFSAPVTNPILNVAGLGQTYTTLGGGVLSAGLTIVTPGVTFGAVDPDANNLVVTGGTLQTATQPTGNNVAGGAGAGSVQLLGTFTAVTFDTSLHVTTNPATTGAFTATAEDSIFLNVTLQDTERPMFACTDTVYRNGVTPGDIVGSPTSALTAPTVAITYPQSWGLTNALGISPDGTRAYVTTNGDVGIYSSDPSEPAFRIVTAAGTGTNGVYVAGAVHPITGNYYYGSVEGGHEIYMYNPTTGASFQVGTSPGTASAAGDFAFTAAGDMVLLSGATLRMVLADDVPTAPGTAVLGGGYATGGVPTATQRVRQISSGGFPASNGIAFGGDGLLYITQGGSGTNGGPIIGQHNPNNGVPLTSVNGNAGDRNDLGSCSYGQTISVQKAVNGRVLPTDQFQLNLQAAGTTAQTDVTEGTATGLQTKSTGHTVQAGPQFGVAGTTYTISETAAGTTNLSLYGTTYSCVDETSGQVHASGAGQSFNFTYPPGVNQNIVCTFTNGPLQPAMTLVKSSSTASFDAVGDTIDYDFLVTNTGNATLTSVSVSDALAGVSIVTPAAGDWPSGVVGTLNPGDAVTFTGTYTVTQADVDAGMVHNSATSTGNPPTGPPVTTPPSEIDVPGVRTPSIMVDKTASPAAVVGAGQPITYTFQVTNNGNVTLTGVTLTDPLPGLIVTTPPAASWPSGTVGTLRPGDVVTYTGTYTTTAADVTAGSVPNTATVTGAPPAGLPPVSDTDDAVVTVSAVPNPSISIDKSASPTTVTGSGQSIAYTFVVTNTGTTVLNNVAVTDVLPGLTVIAPTSWPSGTVGTMNPGDIVTFTGTYTTTAGDVTAGEVENTATASGNPPGGPAVSDEDTAIVTVITPNPALTIEKSSTTSTYAAVGDVIDYEFLVTNTGNVPMTGVTVNDTLTGVSVTTPPAAGWPSGTVGTLNPGDQVTFSGTYTVTQADIDAGSVVNSATATGTPPGGTPVTTPPDSVTVPAVQSPALTIEKSSSTPSYAAVGDVIDYEFLVSNTGNTVLTGVSVNDALAGVNVVTPPAASWPSGTVGTLNAGDQVMFTGTYTVTQADVDAGNVVNSATATGTPPGGTPVTTPPDSVDVPAVQSPVLTIEKSSTTPSYAAVGDVIDYEFLVSNTGNVTMTGVAVNDALAGVAVVTPPAAEWPSGTVGTLNPGDSVTFTGTYTVTQADIDAGNVVNSATATGTPPGGTPVTTPPDSVDVPAVPNPALTIEKSALTSSFSAVGDVIQYEFLVSNTGNVTLTGVTVNDPLIAAVAPAAADWPSGTVGTLAPGDQVTFTGSYTVTQADLDAGSVVNAATATGTPPTGTPVTTPPSTETVPGTPNPMLTIEKSSTTPSYAAVGDVIDYEFLVTNTGNVVMTGVTVNDALAGVAVVTPPAAEWPSGTVGTLNPGDQVTFTGSYTVTQADLDAGSVTNSATATGNPPSGPPTTTPPSTIDVPAVPNPALTIVKSSPTTEFSAVGQTIDYEFLVSNTGNVTMTAVTVNDVLAGVVVVTPPAAEWPSGTVGTLAPGQHVTFTGTYTVTQADLDAGSVINSATATGTPPTGTPVTTPPSSVEVPANPNPALTIAKSSTTPSYAAVGDVIDYEFLVSNTGNVTMTSVVVNDALAGVAVVTPPAAEWPSGTVGTLNPGDQVTFTGTYTVTQADLDAGTVTNSATATGTPPVGPPTTTPPSTVDVPAVPNPALTIVKSSTTASFSAVGDVIDYEFLVSNTGNVTMTGVVVNDALAGVAVVTPPAAEWPSGTVGTLNPGDQVTFTGTYTVTQADLDAGSVVNSASATGTPPSGPPTTTPPSTVDVPGTSSPALTIAKSSTTASYAAVGDVIDYEFLVSNTGNVTMTGVVVNDALAGVTVVTPPAASWPSGTVGTLNPGDQVTFTGTYTVTQADLDAGSVTNSATATGNPPSGPPTTTPPSTIDVPAVPNPALTIVKSSPTTSFDAVGDVIDYEFLVSNTGNVTMTGVTVNDPLVNVVTPVAAAWPSGTVGTLAPGDQVTFTGSYTVTQADVDAGSVVNAATATGNPPSGPPTTTPPSTVDVPANPNPGLTVAKSSTTASYAAVGDVIDYEFLVSNTGNVTMTGVVVNDALAGVTVVTPPAASWPSGTVGTLAPGDEVTFTGTYTVTQADLDAGSVTNSATATGTPPTGEPVTTPPSTVEVPAVPNPALTIVKSSSTTSFDAVGDVIDYEFLVSNTGNVTMTSVTVNDPLVTVVAPAAAGWPSGTVGTLNPGDQVTFTGSYTVTQADLDAGSVMNAATATGTPPVGPPTTTPPSTVEVPGNPAPGLTIVKSSDTTSFSAVGDVIDYEFLVSNTGNVTLTGVVVNDALAGVTVVAPDAADWPSGIVGTLNPGDAVTFTGTYTVTQADLDAGSVTNSATGTGTPPTGEPVTTPPSTVEVPGTPAPALTIVKSSDTTSFSAVGDVIDYEFLVSNTGNVTMTGVAVTDALAGVTVVAPDAADWPSGTVGTLAPGDQVTFTGTYTVTQADLDAGSVTNSATATGTPPTGEPVTTPPSTVEVPATVTPALTIVKSSPTTSFDSVGDVIDYEFLVSNTGNVPLTDVTVTDALAGVTVVTPEPAAWPSGTVGTLNPGDSVTFTGTYTVTQADLDAGSVVNAATGTGTPPVGPPTTTPPSTVEVPGTPAPALTIVKSSPTTSFDSVGDVIDYEFLVSNTGNVTFTDVTVTDALAGVTVVTPEAAAWPSGTVGTLNPGDQVTFTGTYTVTQADLDAGSVMNAATGTGTPPVGPPTTTPPSTVEVPGNPAPALTIVKSSPTTSFDSVGDVIDYEFLVSNTGNVTFTDVTVTDVLAGVTVVTPEAAAWPSGTVGTLNPGDSVTFTGTYTVTQADLDAGSVMNAATGTGTPPVGPPTTTPPSTVEVPGTPVPALTIVKSSPTGAFDSVGDVIDYEFLVSNTGNVPVTGVTVSDALAGVTVVTPEAAAWPSGTVGTLNPGDKVTFTGTYTVTQADLDAGSVMNAATATGTPPVGPPTTTPPSTVEVPGNPMPGIVLEKSTLNSGPYVQGDTVEYLFTVKNTGNVILRGVVISDELSGLGKITYTWPGEAGVLLPGQEATARASYVVTSADVARGSVLNVATATGTPPVGEPPVSTDRVTVKIKPKPALPVTGAVISDQLGLAGAVALLGGIAFLFLARRRRESM